MEETAAIKLQSFNRGKTTRKHTKRLQLYKNLPDDLKNIISKNYNKIDILRRENSRLLLDGAEKGDLRKVKYALNNYADINAKDDDVKGWTALHYASLYDHIEIVELLLREGANVNATDEWDQTALHHASSQGHPEVVKLLLAAGADVNAKNLWDRTALHNASYNGDLNVVEMLLEKRAKVYATDEEGPTPLHLASEYGHLEIVKLLLKNNPKPDVNATDKKGKTALDLAKNDVIKKLLQAHIEKNKTQT